MIEKFKISCENLENQSDENTTPYSITKASQSEYIVVVKNKKDDTVLIKIIGDGHDYKIIKKDLKKKDKYGKSGLVSKINIQLKSGLVAKIISGNLLKEKTRIIKMRAS